MRILIILIAFVSFCACNGQKKEVNQKANPLIGEWISYRTETPIEDRVDAFGVGDSIETFYSVKQRYEFNTDGSGKELTLAPDDIFKFDYQVKNDLLLFYDRIYKIEKLVIDTLILVELDADNYKLTSKIEYGKRIHFKRTK